MVFINFFGFVCIIVFVLSLFQVPMKQHKDCNFSYAGLKTQVRLAIESKNMYALQIHLNNNHHDLS